MREWTKACWSSIAGVSRTSRCHFSALLPSLIGKGAGRALLQHCLPAEWEHRPQRVWLHTCTSDHPAALSFY